MITSHKTSDVASHDHKSLSSTGKTVYTDATEGLPSSEKSSSSSLPYSFYELPGSQHSGSDQSQGGLELSQYDGAGASRQASRGAYHSIRLHGYRAPASPYPEQSRVPTSPTPQPNPRGHSGLSPLPVHPYSRSSSGQYNFRPSIDLLTSDDILGADQDALTAAQRNTPSPLDLVQERATSHMHRISAQMQANRTRSAAMPRPGSRLQRSGEFVLSAQQRTMLDGSRWQPVNSGRDRSTVGGRQQIPYGMQQYRYPSDRQVTVQEPPSNRGVLFNPRANQRSSENVPVSNSTLDTHPRAFNDTARQDGVPGTSPNIPNVEVRNTDHVAGNLAIPLCYSLPQPPRPRDTSNRPHMVTSRSPHPFGGSDGGLSDPVGSIQMEAHTHPVNMIRGPRSQPPRFARPEDRSVHFAARRARPTLRLVSPIYRSSAVPPAYLFQRPLSRGPPSTSTTLDVAEGVTSRHPPPPGVPSMVSHNVTSPTNVAVNNRRIPVQQQDQENRGELEREMEVMREELAAVGVRYGDNDGRQERMDETPPRIGRIERRMGN
ncbi:unnamed protein product [Periconia digitata]|uniref:Uncharacterized protein n=1 Tax=Periconia digitata TaxID=1303443 RepID=A0A9W4U837_9PLEO|nr:unnamed protein product [Periconia digitata]